VPAADMAAWSSQVIERFKALLNVKEISDETADEGLDGQGDEVELKRIAVARNRNPHDVEAAHEALTALAFDGYQDWCEYDDDDWTRNCLGQVLDADQSGLLITTLEEAGLIDLTTAIELMAGPYRTAWQRAAENEATESGNAATAHGLIPGENVESWTYSRTPGTRYYIFTGGQYLYSDDKDAPLRGWATAQARDDEAALRATEWETGSRVFYTTYANPAHVGGVEYVFGRSKYGPWTLTRSQAQKALDEYRRSQGPGGVAGAGRPIEPYYDTGHFTRYGNGTYTFGESANATTWYSTYAELLDALAARTAPAVTTAEAEALRKLLEAVPEARDLSADDLAEAIAAGMTGP
jgi:hypothetical protein